VFISALPNINQLHFADWELITAAHSRCRCASYECLAWLEWCDVIDTFVNGVLTRWIELAQNIDTIVA